MQRMYGSAALLLKVLNKLGQRLSTGIKGLVDVIELDLSTTLHMEVYMTADAGRTQWKQTGFYFQ